MLEVIQEITRSQGSFVNNSLGATFMAPRNFTGNNLYYRITVTSVETGEIAFTIDLTVQSEADPLNEAVTALRTVQNAEQMQKMSEGLASISSPGESGGSSGETAGEGEAPVDGETGGKAQDPTSGDGETVPEAPDQASGDEENVPEAPDQASGVEGTVPEAPDQASGDEESIPESETGEEDGTEWGSEEA